MSSSDALSQHLPSYLGFSYLGQGDLLTAASPDLERGVAPLGPPAPMQPLLLGYGVAPLKVPISSVQLLSHVWLFATPCQASLSITNSQKSLKLTSIELVMPFSHLILCRPLFLLTPIPPSIRVFSNDSTLHMRWPKYWSFSFSIRPSNEHPGLISFRMDWLDLLAVQGTLKSLLRHHSEKASFLWHSTFFTVQLSHPYMTTWKNHSLDQTDLCWQSNVSAFECAI